MLNIPCGNGRLLTTFNKYFGVIDCVDPCEMAINTVTFKKKEASVENIGNISLISIQNW